MRRAPAAGKKCAQAAGQHSLPQKCVQEATHAPHICCRIATNAEILRKRGGLWSIFVCNRNLARTGLPHAPSPRAKLQATWVRGPTDDCRSSPQGSAGSRGLIGGCDGVGASRPRSRLWPSECAREYAAVDEQVLPGDVAGLGGAQKGAGGAEFIRRAEALGGDGHHALVPCLLDRDA